MRIILSRKGFDSSAGGVPSPILPDGRLCSLPIPESGPHPHPRRYGDLYHDGQALGPLVRDLTRGRLDARSRVHLDPDLRRDAVPRPAGWRPAAGQAGAAESHLRRQGVGPGDLFLFFGWFRRVERAGDRWRYVPRAPHLHVLFGWLQIAERLPVRGGRLPAWLRGHPHCKRRPYDAADSIYIAAERLELAGRPRPRAGAGVFARYHDELRLTAADGERSLWRLPRWAHPAGRRSHLTYHGRATRWRAMPDHVLLRTVGRGQEFVLDGTDYPEAVEWAAALLARHGDALDDDATERRDDERLA